MPTTATASRDVKHRQQPADCGNTTLRLGIALYHRLPFPELLERATAPLLDLLGDTTQLQLWLGDDPRGDATPHNLADVAEDELTRGRDRPLTIAPLPTASAPFALVHDPRLVQRRAVRTHLLAIVLPDARTFDRTAFERLCLACDVRYAFATPARSLEAALDEVLWPDPPARMAPSHARRHPDAWLQLMRSFGRPDIDHGVPDVYWLNVFGNLLVNELRRLDCWDELEQATDLRYLDNGAVLLQLASEPTPEDHPEVAPRTRAIGDIVAPVGLLQRALLQARQGDLLLLEALVATGDARLLPGLVFPQGLDAFRRLLATTSDEADTITSLDDARALLARTAADRPRGYGEPRRTASAAPPPAEAAAVGTEAAAPAPEAPNATTAPGVPPAELAPAPAFDRDSPQWRIDSMTRGALRLDLASLRWTPSDAPEKKGALRHLDAALINDLPCKAELHALQAVILRDGQPHSVHRVRLPHDTALDARGALTPIALDVPAPGPTDELLVQATITLCVRTAVADIVRDDAQAGFRPLSAAPHADRNGASLVHDTWPVRLVAAPQPDDAQLVLQLTNTMQQTWNRWSIALVAADDPLQVFDEVHSTALLEAGRTTWTTLDTRRAASTEAGGGNLQLRLETRSDLELVLAGFRPRDA